MKKNDRYRKRNGYMKIDMKIVRALYLRAFVYRPRLLTEKGPKQKQRADLSARKIWQQVTDIRIAEMKSVHNERYEYGHTHYRRQ